MAALYERERSRFWWIEYRDAAGEKRRESTKLRRDRAGETREARALERELTRREAEAAEQGAQGRWESWVPNWIEQRYADSPLSLARYRAAWRNLSAFLVAHEIVVPRQLTRQNVRYYIVWRGARHGDLGVHKGAKNTALLEVKLLGAIVREAVESGFCAHNPCLQLGIGRSEAKRKPEITIDEHRLITRALKRKPEWMRVSYKIAWEQGCRFSETCLPLHDVDLARDVLRLRTKGKKKSVAEVPLSPKLRPLFRRLIGEGRERTFECPALSGKLWWRFFHVDVGLPHLCFHCTRVSFITRCYRLGLPREMVMRLCLHASTTVHEIYPRLCASQDLRAPMRLVAGR